MDIYSIEEGEVRDRQEMETVVKEETTILAIQEEKKYKTMRWSWKTYLACVCSLLVSLVGGAILAYWVVKHHPSNTQLWMVPAGLILFTTPVFIWLSSIVSDLCCTTEGVLQSQPEV